uniref:Splicing factor Cactin n=1 Tax=Oryza punctata TaxID=4537 RepID=A0A0E0KTS3_ORYPU
MAKPRAAEEISRPSRSLSKAVRRRADAVSAKLAARGLGAFVWQKKLERDLARGILPDIVSLRDERRRCLARRREATGVRASADASRRRSPPPILDASRARAEEEAKEAAFLLEQSRLRAEARFASGRPKPIDVLVKSLDGTRRCALAAFRGASVEELKELGEEIAVYAGLDSANEPFWAAAKTMCDAEIVNATGHGERALHSAVFADVKSVVEGKSLDELDAMQHAIAAQMATGEAKVVEHWQEVTELIRVEKAKKYLEQHYSTTCDENDGGDQPKSTEEYGGGGAEDADEEGSESLRPMALPPPGPEWRKPKYIARVRSSFEWNKYNRAHYDHDHPPPKTVKGYKFVLYYPDLAGGKPPQYTVDEDDGGSSGGETCIIRFHASWPYEDVAFRIVNKEWEYSRKAGFRCTFDRGVLHLNFQFKRLFYRR